MLPDEREGVLTTSTASLLIGDEDVYSRVLPVADVIDEGDFGAEVIEITLVAVEIDSKLLSRRARLR